MAQVLQVPGLMEIGRQRVGRGAGNGRRRDCHAEPEHREKGKGCDIGYALAISSCEGAHSVETCTVTAL